MSDPVSRLKTVLVLGFGLAASACGGENGEAPNSGDGTAPDAVVSTPAESQLRTASHLVEGNWVQVFRRGLEERQPGNPVLVLQGGAGSMIQSWGVGFVSAIAELSPVVAYNRPGTGSVFDGTKLTPDRVAEHLHSLLGVLGVPPPYVLVGHSWGGPLILYYAGRYPEEVVGMVYVDPSHPERPPSSLPAGRRWAASEARIEYWQMSVEDRAIPASPRIPTAIVLAPPTEAANTLRVERFREWSHDIPQLTLVVAPSSGHFVHHDDPDLVVDLVRQVLAAVGGGR